MGGSEGLRFGEPGGIPWALLEGLEGVEYLVHTAESFGAWARAEADKGAGLGVVWGALALAALVAVASVAVAIKWG